jgi:3-deoxy-D-manno-octulosonic-acid transferase
MQSSIDYQRAIDIGADPQRVLLTGNMKFDQKAPDYTAQKRDELRKDFDLGSEDRVFIAGSTHSGEEVIILDVFRELMKEYPRMVLILAPRHPERFQEVERIVKDYGLALVRKTQMSTSNRPFHSPVILLDTIGELSRIYEIGNIIFVGGSFVNIGGHNVLEPVVHKKPVVFGPHMQNFSEIAQALEESGAGILARTKKDLLVQARELLRDEKRAQRLGEKGFQVIKKHQGATERNMEMINRFIE